MSALTRKSVHRSPELDAAFNAGMALANSHEWMYRARQDRQWPDLTAERVKTARKYHREFIRYCLKIASSGQP